MLPPWIGLRTTLERRAVRRRHFKNISKILRNVTHNSERPTKGFMQLTPGPYNFLKPGLQQRRRRKHMGSSVLVWIKRNVDISTIASSTEVETGFFPFRPHFCFSLPSIAFHTYSSFPRPQIYIFLVQNSIQTRLIHSEHCFRSCRYYVWFDRQESICFRYLIGRRKKNACFRLPDPKDVLRCSSTFLNLAENIWKMRQTEQ